MSLLWQCSATIDADLKNKKIQNLSGKTVNWHSNSPIDITAGEGARTLDIHVGKGRAISCKCCKYRTYDTACEILYPILYSQSKTV